MEIKMQNFFSKIIELKSQIEKNQFSGYASVFNIKDRVNDIILPGAFGTSIDSTNIKLLWQHDHKEPIGYFKKIEETQIGLYVEAIILEETNRGKEALTLINNGVLNSLSIGFEAEDFYYKGNIRYIKKIRLWEISLVTFPAHEQAKIHNIKSQELNRLNHAVDKIIKLINFN